MKWRTFALGAMGAAVASVTPLLGGCGGGSDAPQAPVVRLCPASLDYTTTFTGGAGSGELVQLQLDTTKLTWQVTYVESPIPAVTGTVSRPAPARRRTAR